MEILATAEGLMKDSVAVARFIGERLVGGAFASLANIVLQDQPDENNIVRGEE